MGLMDLLSDLHTLSRADKLRAMSFLVQELADEEDIKLTPGTEYAVWSPYESADAANKLLELLKAAETITDE